MKVKEPIKAGAVRVLTDSERVRYTELLKLARQEEATLARMVTDVSYSRLCREMGFLDLLAKKFGFDSHAAMDTAGYCTTTLDKTVTLKRLDGGSK